MTNYGYGNVSAEVSEAIEVERALNIAAFGEAVRNDVADETKRRQTLARIALPTLALIAERRPMEEPFKLIAMLCGTHNVHVSYLGNLVELDDTYQAYPNPDNPRALELAQADPIELADGIQISRQQLADFVDRQLHIEDAGRVLAHEIAILK